MERLADWSPAVTGLTASGTRAHRSAAVVARLSGHRRRRRRVRRCAAVTLYEGWQYVLVNARPRQAASWRTSDAQTFWKGALPNLMFPVERSWLVSTLWDDVWTCIGGPVALVEDLLRDLELGPRARRISPENDDATPAGHDAR
jgi:hypothetical protein